MATRSRSYIGPRQIKPLVGFPAAGLAELNRIGINISRRDAETMFAAAMDNVEAYGMDALPGLQTTAGIPTALQFLQQWLPGFVRMITAARKIDELVGINTVGDWEDEQVVQGQLELTGSAVPYGDYTNVPLSSWNLNYDYRTIVRFEEGMRVGILEERRTAKTNVNTANEKRDAAALALEINRNLIGFYGYNNGSNHTYGFLNDPLLPAYVGLPNGVSGSSKWLKKTFQEITADIRTAMAQLQIQSGDTIDPGTTAITMALAFTVAQFLSVTTDQGQSVRGWLKDNYPQLRIVTAPELAAAHGTDDVFYLYAEKLSDTSTDNGQTFDQFVPTKFMMLGVQKQVKGYLEDYSNATAGVMCKRPFAVVRYYGC